MCQGRTMKACTKIGCTTMIEDNRPEKGARRKRRARAACARTRTACSIRIPDILQSTTTGNNNNWLMPASAVGRLYVMKNGRKQTGRP